MQRYATSYFGYFRHACLCTPKTIVSTCRILFFCIPRINFIIHFFLQILLFQESCNLIGWTAFWLVTWEPEFCQIWDLWWNISYNIGFYFKLFLGKTNHKIFQKEKKNLFWGHFWVLFSLKLGKKSIFLEKKGSVSF